MQSLNCEDRRQIQKLLWLKARAFIGELIPQKYVWLNNESTIFKIAFLKNLSFIQ